MQHNLKSDIHRLTTTLSNTLLELEGLSTDVRGIWETCDCHDESERLEDIMAAIDNVLTAESDLDELISLTTPSCNAPEPVSLEHKQGN